MIAEHRVLLRRFSWRRAAFATTLAGAMLLAISGLGVASAGAASNETAAKRITTVTVELPTASGLSYLGEYVGIKYGIYKKYGINVTMQVIKSTLASSLVEAGKLDMMAATGSAESTSVHGYRIPTYVAQGIQQEFTLSGAKGITSVAQLKGKVIIGESAISASNEWERAVLKHYGVTPQKTVTFVTIGSSTARVAYLKAGEGSAAALTTLQGLQLQKSTDLKVLSLGNFSTTDLVAGGLAASPTWVNTHRKLMKNMVAATIASTKFMIENKAKTLAVLEGKPYTATATLANEVYKDVEPTWTATGKPPKIAIENQLHTLQLEYSLPTPPNATLVFTWQFVPKSS